jgi:hypothetical protein
MAARCKLLKAILTFLALLAASVASSRGQTPPKPTYSWVTLVPQGSTPSPVAEGLCWTQTDGMHCYYSGAAHGPFLASGGVVGLTIGSTTIASGTTGRVLYDNGGLLGELTDTQLTTHINAFTTSLKGAAPASGGGTTNYLRADGTWAAPPGTSTGTVTTTGSPASGNLSKFSGATSITNADLTGDLTTSGTVATTLATVNSNVGSFGDGTHVGAFTVNGKGLITAASSVAITGAAPSGSASGDLSGSYPGPTVAKVNAVTYPSAPAANTVPVVTSATSGGTITYETVPVAAGGTGLSSGTSGGVLAYTGSGTLASSGALGANLPVIGGGAGAAPTTGTRSGNTTSFGTTNGTLTNGHCVSIDASGNLVDNGAACGTGSGSVTSVGVGSSGSTILPTNTPVTGAGTINVEINLGHANTWTAAQSFDSGDLKLNGATSGTITLNAAGTAGTNTITLPAGTTDFSGTGGTSQVVKQTSSGGAFTVGQLACADLSNGATSCSTDATNASNISSGTLPAGRLPALTGDVTSSAGSAATTLAAGSASNLNSGTLAAGRLPALTGDVTSSAGSAATTLAAGSASSLNSGTLAAARGGAGTISGALKGNGAGVVSQAACSDLSNGATGCSTATGTSGATIPLLNGANTWSNSQAGSITTLAISTATFTPDASNNHYKLTLVHASCPCTFANPSPSFVAGTSGVIEIVQSSTGSDTIGTWGSSYLAPSGTSAIVLSTAANAIDVLAYFVIDSTHILLIPSLNFSH